MLSIIDLFLIFVSCFLSEIIVVYFLTTRLILWWFTRNIDGIIKAISSSPELESLKKQLLGSIFGTAGGGRPQKMDLNAIIQLAAPQLIQKFLQGKPPLPPVSP